MTASSPTVQPLSGEIAINEIRPRRVRRWLRRSAFLGVAAVLVLGGAGFERATEPAAPPDREAFALIAQAWDLLHSEYVDGTDLDSSTLARGAIRGMAAAVGDTGHTYFLTHDEATAADEELSGSYGGIGINLDASATVPTISSLVPGAPAAAAGLRVGDRITAVDGTSTDGPDQAHVVDAILGTPGTVVILTIDRPGQSGSLAVSVTRAEVAQSPVDWAMIPGTKLALVNLALFSDKGVSALRAAIGRAMTAGATGLILDLRGNPGGIVEDAVHVAPVFLRPGNVVVRTRDADGVEFEYTVPSDAVTVDLPLVVLANGDSASSAEIVVGALQDAGRATVIGSTTFGTGTLVDEFPLADNSQLWIGVVAWQTPAGRSAWHLGLTPDVGVTLPTGVAPVAPDRLASLGPKGLAKSGDAPLLRAIAVLGTH